MGLQDTVAVLTNNSSREESYLIAHVSTLLRALYCLYLSEIPIKD